MIHSVAFDTTLGWKNQRWPNDDDACFPCLLNLPMLLVRQEMLDTPLILTSSCIVANKSTST
jgi:hypothetical protein